MQVAGDPVPVLVKRVPFGFGAPGRELERDAGLRGRLFDVSPGDVVITVIRRPGMELLESELVSYGRRSPRMISTGQGA